MNKNIQKFWNKEKTVNEFKDAPIQEYWRDLFADITNKSAKKVLDMGCGGGRYTQMLVEMGFQVYAFDLHKNMVEATKDRLATLKPIPTVLQTDMVSLPFKNEEFDYILSNGLFHNAQNLADLERSISEAARVLKKNGKLCLNMFYDGKGNTNLTKTKNKIYITQDSTPMTLLKLSGLIDLLKINNLLSMSEIITYTREMEVGTRDVMRGVFKKFVS